MYTIEEGVLQRYIPESNEMEVTLPEGITRIAAHAFSDAPMLRTIYLPESLEEIDHLAFLSDGGHLETIYIPDGVKKIAKGAFMDCTELKTVSISENLVPLTNEGLDSIFSFIAGKTLLLIVRMNNGPDRKMVISCGQYGSVVFSPINQDTCESYDHLLVAGKIKLNRINEEGRLRGMIWRLQDEQWPVKEETVSLFVDFLAEKVNKAVALAIKDNESSYIQILCSIGVINADNSAKIKKKLASSKMPMFEAMADQLDKMINAAASGAQETVSSSPEEEKCAKWMKDNKGDKILLGLGIEQIDPVYYADGKTIAPELLVKFVIASLIAYPNEKYYEDEWIEGLKRRQHLYRPAMALRDTNEIACLLDHDSLLRAIKILYDSADRKRQTELCNPLFRFADGNTVQAVYNQFRKTWYETAVINAIELSDSREAMMLAEKCKVLKRYAELRGTTEDDIRDTRIFEYGLDEKGQKEYDLGSKRIIAELQKDLSIRLTDVETGKTVKETPHSIQSPRNMVK